MYETHDTLSGRGSTTRTGVGGLANILDGGVTRQQDVGVGASPLAGKTDRTGGAGLTGRVWHLPPGGRRQYVWSEMVCAASSIPACRGRGEGRSDTPGAETRGFDGVSGIVSTFLDIEGRVSPG